MIYHLTTTFHPGAFQCVKEEPHWRAGGWNGWMDGWMEWNRGESLSDIYPYHQFQHLKSPSLGRFFFFVGKAPVVGNRGGENELERKKGGGKLFLRHVSLICSPAANKNDDLRRVFFLSPGSASGRANHTAGTTCWTSVIFKYNEYDKEEWWGHIWLSYWLTH